MYGINSKIKNFTPYPAITNTGGIRLDANESYLSLPESITNEIAGKIKGLEFNRYPDPYCTEAVRAFADYYGISAENITAGNGSDELISVIINSFFNKGDKVLITSPEFSMYKFYCDIAELKTVEIKKEKDYGISAEDIIKAAKKEQVKGVVFSNPCNPTANMMSGKDAAKIIKELSGSLIILDEAYIDFTDDGGLLKTADREHNLIVLKTCSKNFGLAAIRLGFAVSNPIITKALKSVKSPYNVSSLTNASAAVVLRKKEYLQSALINIKKQTEKLYKELCKIKSVKAYKTHTNFVFADCKDNKSVYEQLINKGVFVRYTGGNLRITAGSDEEINALVRALKEIL